MDLAVDDARQHVQAPAVDPFGGGSPGEVPEFGDAAASDADVALTRAVMVDYGCAGQNEVEGLGHGSVLARSPTRTN